MSERDRIELIMKSYELSPSQFADRTGIQRASVSHILSGRNKASLEVMLKIYEAFPGLDMEWLMTGKGKEPGKNEVTAALSHPSSAVAAGLFSEPVAEKPVMPLFTAEQPLRMQEPEVVSRRSEAAPVQPRERRVKKQVSRSTPVASNDFPVKRIKEVRVYYTDGTYEILVPER